MWYAMAGILVGVIIYLLINVSCLKCEVSEIKNNRCSVNSGCEEYINSVMNRNHYLSEYGRRYVINEETKMQIRHIEEIHDIRGDLEKQIRLNASFCDFKNREVTIKEALRMLFNHLKLAIKPGDDIKIVKLK